MGVTPQPPSLHGAQLWRAALAGWPLARGSAKAAYRPPRTVGSASSPGRSLLASSCAFFFSPFLPMLRMRLTVPPRPQGPRGGSSSVEVSAGSQVAASLGGSAPWGVLLLGSPQLCSTPGGASERVDAGGEMAVFPGSFGSNLCTGSRREQGMNFTGLWMLSRWGGAHEACCSWGARQEREHEGSAAGARYFLRTAFPLPCLNPRDPQRYWHTSLPYFCTTHSTQCVCYPQPQGWSFSPTVSTWLGTHLTSGGHARGALLVPPVLLSAPQILPMPLCSPAHQHPAQHALQLFQALLYLRGGEMLGSLQGPLAQGHWPYQDISLQSS